MAFGQASYPTPYTFMTLAGYPGSGFSDGTGRAARFSSPHGVAADSAGNIFVADTLNHNIRRVAPTGVTATVAGMPGEAGGADGIGSAARFNQPFGVAVDGAGNLYVADSGNSTIRMITPDAVVTTLAGTAGESGFGDGTGGDARFSFPTGIAVDGTGDIYVADNYNCTIRAVTPAGQVTTLAGMASQPGSVAGFVGASQLAYPAAVAVNSAGSPFVADTGNSVIGQIGPDGYFSVLAGQVGIYGYADGVNSDCQFNDPTGVAVDLAGNLYVSDTGNEVIRLITLGEMVTTVAGMPGVPGGADGTNDTALFNLPAGLAADPAGNIYVADAGNSAIRIMTGTGVVSTLAGLAGNVPSADGAGDVARFSQPYGVAADASGNVYVADQFNSTVRKITPAGVVTTIAGTPGSVGSADGTMGTAQFHHPGAVAVDGPGDLYVADTFNSIIRKVTSAGVVTTLAGQPGNIGGMDGTNSAAQFFYPYGIAVESAGGIYVADTFNHAIRKVSPAGVVTTLAGATGNGGAADGTNGTARFSYPYGLAVDAAGKVYVADSGNSTIRMITSAGVVTTIAGTAGSMGDADGAGGAARFNFPTSIAVDSAGNLFVTDEVNDTIRLVTPDGNVSTVAGLPGVFGGVDGTGSRARFGFPTGIAVDSSGNLYVADSENNTIRKGIAAGRVPRPLLIAPRLDGGWFGFAISGLPGLMVDVESSADMTRWQWAGTYVLAGGTNNFSSATPVSGARFYRALAR